MDRSKRTALVVGIAVILRGCRQSWNVSRRRTDAGARPPKRRPSDVVVAQHPLTLGTRITPDHIKVVEWPADPPVAGAFGSVAEVVDRGLIAAGRSQRAAHRRPSSRRLEAGAGLPPSIPPGMRAMSVKVNEVIGVAGFVVPGTRVDVHGDADASAAAGQRDARGRQQRAGADRGHALRPGEGQGRQRRFPRRS